MHVKETLKRTSAILNNKALIELSAVLSVCVVFLIELSHVTTSSWKVFFFSNSDTLTLALVKHSVDLKEHFHWVFSSQIFLFPESILYALSSILTPNFRAALILNSLLTCLLIYLFFRLIAKVMNLSNNTARASGLAAVSLILLLSLLEPRTDNGVATYFLVTTFYYGIVLSSLMSITLSLYALRHLRTFGRKSWQFLWSLAGLFIIGTLTSLSNPLYLFQFVAPLMVVCTAVWLVNRISFRQLTCLLLPQILGGVLGLLLRKLFLADYFSKMGEVGNYLHYADIYPSMVTLRRITSQMYHGNGGQRLEIILILGLMVLAFTTFLFVVHTATSPNEKKNGYWRVESIALLTGLAGITPLIVLLGAILTGNPLTRYLLPLIFYPLLLLPVAGGYIFDSRKRHIKNFTFPIILIVTLLLLISFFNPLRTLRGVSDYYTSDQSCLDNAVGTSATGVAQYWRARGLELNSHKDIRVLQSIGLLARFTWLYNTAAYDKKNVSFIVVDKLPPPHFDQEVSYSPAFTISSENTIKLLGEPTAKYDCPSFYVYTYPPTNDGYRILNQRFQDKSLGLW